MVGSRSGGAASLEPAIGSGSVGAEVGIDVVGVGSAATTG